MGLSAQQPASIAGKLASHGQVVLCNPRDQLLSPSWYSQGFSKTELENCSPGFPRL